jgi:transcriptional regulator with XRE-family HTH domain
MTSVAERGYLMEAQSDSLVQLSREKGIAMSAISEVPAGKKPFRRQMICKLADYFKVDDGMLMANL